ncbi:hypothetical protein ACF1DY_06605 [Streptomyces albus]
MSEMNIRDLMYASARTGACVLVTCNSQHLEERKGVWTISVTGGPWRGRPLRDEGATLDACLPTLVGALPDRPCPSESGMDAQNLMQELSHAGVTVLVKCDGERLREGGRPWTFVASGGPLEERPVRRDDITLDACLVNASRLLMDIGPEWTRIEKHLP